MERNDSREPTTERNRDDEQSSSLLGDQNRRGVLKTLAAMGMAGTGVASVSGSAAAEESTELEEIEIEETTVYAEEDTGDFEAGEKLGTFSGVLEIQKSYVDDPVSLAGSDGDALTAVHIEEGKLEGTFDSTSSLPSGEVKQTWSGSPLMQILDVLSPDSSGECPVLDLELGPLFLDLLGLEVSLSEVTLDITAVAGSNNLVGNLLCAVAGLLDP